MKLNVLFYACLILDRGSMCNRVGTGIIIRRDWLLSWDSSRGRRAPGRTVFLLIQPVRWGRRAGRGISTALGEPLRALARWRGSSLLGSGIPVSISRRPLSYGVVEQVGYPDRYLRLRRLHWLFQFSIRETVILKKITHYYSFNLANIKCIIKENILRYRKALWGSIA